MAAHGGKAIDAKEVFDLVSGNTLLMEANDFTSSMYFHPDGNLHARAESMTADDQDRGNWDINGENQLCFKFKTWYYGDMRCFDVYRENGKNSYVLFYGNGAFAYSAKPSSGDTAHLYKSDKPTKKDSYLRESLAAGSTGSAAQPAATPVPAPAPDKKDSYLREKLATGKTAETSKEDATLSEAAVEPTEEPADLASDEEIGHTVKVMAKNCPNCNLEKADLRQANLVGANLKGANLKGADLSRANLRRADLSGADLSGAVLLNTNLPGANLQNAILTGADFSGSNLIKADFTGAKTSNTILTNAHLEGVKGLK